MQTEAVQNQTPASGSQTATVQERNTMKAIAHDTYGEAEVLDLRDVPVPEVGEDEVLVRVHAAGVDAGVTP